jgi:hypothetical protein
MATLRLSPQMRFRLTFDYSADLLAVLFSELDLLDDAVVPELAAVLLPFASEEDDEVDDDSDLPTVSALDESDFVDSDDDESVLVESALAASALDVSPFDFA